MDELILMAEPRTVVGKQVKRLRREGLIPGVVYGPGLRANGTIQVSVNQREFIRFYMAHGRSTLVTLTWNGESQQVFIRDVQEDPIKRIPLHIDFFAPNLQRELVAAIPVVLRHLPEHHEGVLTQVRSEIEVSGFPAALPHEIAFDASRFVNVGDTVHVSDLTLPAGVAAVTPADELIALIAASRVEEPEVAEEIAEEAAPEAEAPVAAAETAESPGEETAES